MRRVVQVLACNLIPVIAVGALAAIAAIVGLPVVSAESPAFFARYSELSQNYANLQTSAHKGLACSACHSEGQGPLVRQLAAAGDFYTGLLGKPKSPMFTKFEKPSREACLGCHRDDWSMDTSRTAKIPHPAHLRVASETRDCVKCHKWTAHEETTMQKHKTMPFSGVCAAYGCHVGLKKTDECGGCHHSLAKGDWKAVHPKVVQAAGPNGCLENCHEISQCRGCHTTGKTPEVSGVAVQSGLIAIQTAHVKADWMQKHGAVAVADQTQCMKCHVSDGECRECHTRRPAFHGSTTTWIGQHKNVAKGNEKRCYTACHEKATCDACHKQFKEMR